MVMKTSNLLIIITFVLIAFLTVFLFNEFQINDQLAQPSEKDHQTGGHIFRRAICRNWNRMA
jgi:hypothetical protein